MPIPPELAERLSALRAQKKTIVFTNGCFDLLHPGHIHQLREAKKLGDFLIVGLNSDASVRRLKGEGRPLLSADARRELLLAIRYVDAVIVFDEDTPEVLIREVQPDVLAKGAEYTEEDIVGAEFVQSCGGRVVRIPMLAGYSTTDLIARVRGK